MKGELVTQNTAKPSRVASKHSKEFFIIYSIWIARKCLFGLVFPSCLAFGFEITFVLPDAQMIQYKKVPSSVFLFFSFFFFMLWTMFLANGVTQVNI